MKLRRFDFLLVLLVPRLAVFIASSFLVVGCSSQGGSAPAPVSNESREGAGWLRGTVDERFQLVAKHLRGFDMAMVEVGYRYTELYWAGRDRNWGYAEYQLGKIERAIADGVERRPARAASARMLEGAIALTRSAIQDRSGSSMDEALTTLTTNCNACHVAERVPFVTVTPPKVRVSPVEFSTPDSEATEQ